MHMLIIVAAFAVVAVCPYIGAQPFAQEDISQAPAAPQDAAEDEAEQER